MMSGNELHVTTAQHLVALGIGVTELEILTNQDGIFDSARAQGLIADMRSTLAQAHSEIRSMSLLFHPPELDDADIADALRRFVSGFARRTGIRANLIIDESLSCRSTQAAKALFRITQEALTNVYRHADASEVRVELRADSTMLVLKIVDNGKGASPRDRERLRRP